MDDKEVARHIGPTIVSLHGVADFRVNPETPLRALNILQKGIKTFPDNVSLCVCYGEVLGQAGDPAGALKSYSDASAMEPNHPLPFLNASRVYQQLNQMQLCKKHMEKAFNLDKSLSLTLVDIAQFKLHEKRFSDQGEAAVSSPSSEEEGMFFEDLSSEEILETAVDVSRHVSEVIDVFTAKQIARFYAKLGASGLAPIFL
jgi:tetratricopeptide (TPR) repeat protein